QVWGWGNAATSGDTTYVSYGYPGGAAVRPVNSMLPAFSGPEYLSQVYEGICPAGTKAVWHNLDWTTSIPTDTQIKFLVQTSSSPTGPWTPSSPALVDTQTTSNATPRVPPEDIQAALQAVGATSQRYLQVTIEFDTTPMSAPTLISLSELYDCVPDE